jgi:hypothetical protein
MVMAKLPPGGTYYEGFGGACNVASVVGFLRPDAKIIITETHPKMVEALKWLQHTSNAADEIIVEMDLLRKYPGTLRDAKFGDPAEWIAGLQLRYPGELTSWNFNPDRGRFASRSRTLDNELESFRLGLKNAIIINEPCSVRKCDVAYLDPPYHLSKTGMYPHSEGGTHRYARIARDMPARRVIVSDFGSAKGIYRGFKARPANQLGAFRTDAVDTIYTLEREHPQSPPLASPS